MNESLKPTTNSLNTLNPSVTVTTVTHRYWNFDPEKACLENWFLNLKRTGLEKACLENWFLNLKRTGLENVFSSEIPWTVILLYSQICLNWDASEAAARRPSRITSTGTFPHWTLVHQNVFGKDVVRLQPQALWREWSWLWTIDKVTDWPKRSQRWDKCALLHLDKFNDRPTRFVSWDKGALLHLDKFNDRPMKFMCWDKSTLPFWVKWILHIDKSLINVRSSSVETRVHFWVKMDSSESSLKGAKSSSVETRTTALR